MAKRPRLVKLSLFAVVVLLGCCGLPLYCVNHLRMEDRPELLYPYYESRLQDYGRRLSAGDVNYEEVRKYGIPQYLIDHGARYCTKHGIASASASGRFSTTRLRSCGTARMGSTRCRRNWPI